LPRGAARALYHLVLGRMPSHDPGRSWRGNAVPGKRVVKVLHVGDCGFRRMELGHDMTAPPGYPLVAAELLREREGVGLAFGHYFAVGYEDLPDMAPLERHMHLEGEPDVVIVQTGGSYARKVVLPHLRPIHRLRADANRRVGRLAYPAHALIRQWVRVAGRYASPYPGVEDFERFLLQLRSAWPEAKLLVVPPFPRSHNYREQLRIAERTDLEMKAAATRYGAAVLDAADALGFNRSLRCANAYNLNAHGSAVVGELLATWITEQVLVPASRDQAQALA
jgi:hypothetical protein